MIFKYFNCDKDPFSNSPDPEFLYLAKKYKDCLNRLEINIRLKRGLSIILGDIGIGKTTLSRKLMRNLGKDENMLTGLILDPFFKTEKQFYQVLLKSFKLNTEKLSVSQLKDKFQNFLFEEAAKKNRTIVLIIDESQKLNKKILEELRILLNYETNNYKLLQLVLLGQMELLKNLQEMENFYNRISFKYLIEALEKEEAIEMIDYRLKKVGNTDGIFTLTALEKIYEYSHGIPRTMMNLCHLMMVEAIIEKKKLVNMEIVDRVIAKEDCFVR